MKLAGKEFGGMAAQFKFFLILAMALAPHSAVVFLGTGLGLTRTFITVGILGLSNLFGFFMARQSGDIMEMPGIILSLLFPVSLGAFTCLFLLGSCLHVRGLLLVLKIKTLALPS